MNARAAPMIGVVMCLALFGAGPSHALSLRSSAAESFLGDALPGTTVVFSRVTGARLRVENAGSEQVRVGFKAASPSSTGLRDGFEPWPYPESVRVEPSRAELKGGGAAEAEITVSVPKGMALKGGQYQFDIVATGEDRSGGSLALRTKMLLSIGAPWPSDEAPAGGDQEMPGFTLAPQLTSGKETLLKIVNAGEEDVTVTFSPARRWNDDVRIQVGYEPAPNPRWLRSEPSVVKVRAGAVGRARIWAEIPRQRRYAGRHWGFVVAVDAKAKGRSTRRYYVLNVNTDEMEEETRVR
jgi:hypothetical protein